MDGRKQPGKEPQVNWLRAAQKDGALAGGVDARLLGVEAGQIKLVPSDKGEWINGLDDYDQTLGARLPDAGKIHFPSVGANESHGAVGRGYGGGWDCSRRRGWRFGGCQGGQAGGEYGSGQSEAG